MGTRLLEFEGIKLVINQSVVPMELESSPRRLELSFHCLLSKVIPFILSTVYIEHLSFDITLICSYMWDLTSWAHIWYGVYLVLFLKPGATTKPFDLAFAIITKCDTINPIALTFIDWIEHSWITGHVLCAPTIKHPMPSSGFIIYLQKKINSF